MNFEKPITHQVSILSADGVKNFYATRQKRKFINPTYFPLGAKCQDCAEHGVWIEDLIHFIISLKLLTFMKLTLDNSLIVDMIQKILNNFTKIYWNFEINFEGDRQKEFWKRLSAVGDIIRYKRYGSCSSINEALLVPCISCAQKNMFLWNDCHCNGAFNGNELSTTELLLRIIDSNCDTTAIGPYDRMKQLLDPTIKSSEVTIDNSHDRKLMEDAANTCWNGELPPRYYCLEDSVKFSGICPFPEKILSLNSDLNISSFERINSKLLSIFNIWFNILKLSKNLTPEQEWSKFRKFMNEM